MHYKTAEFEWKSLKFSYIRNVNKHKISDANSEYSTLCVNITGHDIKLVS